ncbi:hypothetical protein [Streptomyces sp. YGL11-2]
MSAASDAQCGQQDEDDGGHGEYSMGHHDRHGEVALRRRRFGA